MAYPLEDLGSSGFQDLAASLLLAVFGPGIEVMGSGADGGRDMYFDGTLRWVDEQPAEEAWAGYTVFQVKQRESLAARQQDNLGWLWSEVRKELDKWTAPATGRDRTPGQLVFITNVALTPTPERGGHDQIQQNIASYEVALTDFSRDVNEQARNTRLQRLQRFRRIKRIRDRKSVV